jgi:hypothetical protein
VAASAAAISAPNRGQGDTVEASGQVEECVIAPLTDVGQDLPYRTDRLVAVDGRSRQPTVEVGDSAEVESFQHGGHGTDGADRPANEMGDCAP